MSYRRIIQHRFLSRRALKLLHKRVRRKAILKRKRKSIDLRRGSKARKKGKRFSSYFTSLKRKVGYEANIKHIISCADKLKLHRYRPQSTLRNSRASIDHSVVYEIPDIFSLTDNSSESFKFIFTLFNTLYSEAAKVIILDYKNCKRIDVDAQVVMDVFLAGFFEYRDQCRKIGRRVSIERIQPRNFSHPEITKILFSIGSFRMFANLQIHFPNIIPYPLCVGDKRFVGSDRERASQKEIHTTELLDYVIACLARMNRKLNPEARSELCQVVGEILINAEEHSTTDRRYSIGYFEETNDRESHYGIFNLVIFNFGRTIYENFKDPDCPTKHIVDRMKDLSSKYTKRMMIIPGEFTEETLWTLYSLQEGVTSKVNYKKRGNGSIRFIESFFKLKGTGLLKDSSSRLTIHSGNARITFDGSYEIIEKVAGDNKFKVIAFNNSGDIEERPDRKYVTFVPDYFPGTMISATIRVGEEDLERIEVG